jgi:tRNA(Ile)-lysidine synthase
VKNPFENKVLSGLKSCGIEIDSVSKNSPLGVAVSGGADSVSLLLSLASIFDSSCLRVITVDHGIRSEEESGGDAEFVRKVCEDLGVKCLVKKIEHGKIEDVSKESGLSVEAVARNIRYEAFEYFIESENLLALCLAHNQGDLCETLLMRFLQGSGIEGMGGIAQKRGKYVRPLLELSRAEIESYLREKNQLWRTDATNSDTKYLRNRIRNVLVPVLNENFSGWQRAVLGGAKKACADEDFFDGELKKSLSAFEQGRASSLKVGRAYFYSLHPALQRRVFFDSLNKIGFGTRFPFYLFEEICAWNSKKTQSLCFEDVKIFLDTDSLSFSRLNGEAQGQKYIESGFSFVFSKENDRAELENLEILAETVPDSQRVQLSFVSKNDGSKKISVPVRLPCIVRSFCAGDKIKMGDGKFKSVSQVFSDWKIPEELRDKVPLVEELCSAQNKRSEIKALIAFHFGFKNWIVE